MGIGRPNWGWGSKTPVPTFTEDEIRKTMDLHRPGNDGFCLCAWGIFADHDQMFTADHLLDMLKEARNEAAPPIGHAEGLRCPDQARQR